MDDTITEPASASEAVITSSELRDEVSSLHTDEAEQPTLVLPEQPTVILDTPTLKHRATRATQPVPPTRPSNWYTSVLAALPWTKRLGLPDDLTWNDARRAANQVERFVAARPWLWVVVLLICVCILAFLSRQIGG